ncbi:ribose transport system substrate-binding protein [Lachnospiraceae bacterium]|nr:ribose transport system substrate-binding protein [Lachnospiraceae bacterium]
MFKKFLSVALVGVMVASMTACGGSTSTGASAAPAEKAEAVSEAPAEEAPAKPEAESEAASEGAASTDEAISAVAADTEGLDVKNLTLAYVPTTMNNPFWSAMMGGIKDEMKALGMDPETQLVTVDADSDQAKMNNFVYDLINQKVDAVILAPMDTTAVTEALQACADAKIPVINVDTPVDRNDLVESIVASDNYTAGVLCAQDMLEKLDPGSKVYIMNQPSGAACVQREQGFRDTVGDTFEIVGTSDTEGDTATTLPVAEDAITADADLGAFFCINDMGALGCVQAAAAAGRNDILIYGVDGNPDFMGYVKDGSATASAAQQPSVIGSTAVDEAINAINGKTVDKEVVVPVELITGENISNYDISDWQ